MPPSELLIPFLAATAIFALTPGPGMLYMAVQTVAHGARAGWFSSIAFHCASYLHIFAAAFGVTVLLKTAPVLLIALKIVGGCYLIWMGIRLRKRPKTDTQIVQSPNAKPSQQAFRDSLTIEILNPKSALFYFAFLPQFTTVETNAQSFNFGATETPRKEKSRYVNPGSLRQTVRCKTTRERTE